jgi:hypothetical protein
MGKSGNSILPHFAREYWLGSQPAPAREAVAEIHQRRCNMASSLDPEAFLIQSFTFGETDAADGYVETK